MFRTTGVLARLLCTLLLVPGRAQADDGEELIGLRVRALFLEIHGDVASGDDPFEFVHGETVSLREDLDFRRGLWYAGELTIRLGSDDRALAHAAYGRIRNRRTVDEIFDWNDNVYVPGERLKQELSFALAGISWEHRWLGTEDGELWAGLGLAYHTTNIRFEAVNPLVNHDDAVDGERIKAVFPTIEVHGLLDLGGDFRGTAGLRAGVVAIPGLLDENGEGRFIWLTAGLEWSPLPWLSAEIGLDFVWSRTRYHGREKGGGDFDDALYELRLFGPSVSITAAF